MKRQIHIGTFDRRAVFVTIGYTDGVLKITGVVGPTEAGNVYSWGQIILSIKASEIKPNGSLTREQLDWLWAIWSRWHLNDTRAGTQQQMAFVREWRKTHTKDYDAVLKALTEAGLNPDPETGHVYGTTWVKEEVPQDVIDFLFSLPDNGRRPPKIWRE